MSVLYNVNVWIYRNAYCHASGNNVVLIYSDFWPAPREGDLCPNF